LDFLTAKAHFLQKIPYHQCGIALRKEPKAAAGEESKTGDGVEVRKFTSLGEEKWQQEH
jgi:hypothetical protein